MDAKEEKIKLRKQISGLRDALTEQALADRSLAVQESLFGFELFRQARTVMLFTAFRSEVATIPMIERAVREGKRTAVPVSLLAERALLPCEVRDTALDLAPGAYDIMEPPPERRRPVDPRDIDFLCLPGLAFDKQGNRLGYGGGFYDRFLELLRPDCTLAALAFSFQMVDFVPHAPHDKPVQFVVTDKGVIRCIPE
jgi:5-formyltetrahydrofolate cyclo-ligase